MHDDPADENRLFMIISSYFERFGHRFEGKSDDEKADDQAFRNSVRVLRHFQKT